MSYVIHMSYINYISYVSYMSYVCRSYELYELCESCEFFINCLKSLIAFKRFSWIYKDGKSEL